MVPEDTVPVTSQGPELETTGASDKVGLQDKPGEILEHGMEGGRGAGDSVAWGTPPRSPRPSQSFWTSTLCSAELGRTVFGSLPLPAGLCASGSADGPRLWWITEYSRSVVPNLFGTRDQFHGRQVFQGCGVGMVSG